MRFLVDSTAGKLSRWLRILGHDVEYTSSLSPGEMLQLARREKRILLSRNRSLAARDSSVATTLEADGLEDQLYQVGHQFPALERAVPFSRCLICNRVLETVPKERPGNRVPQYVCQTQESFGYCAGCDKYYWKATHWEGMRARLERIFGPRFSELP